MKRKKKRAVPRSPERMQRHKQLAHRFVDRKKEARRKWARGKGGDDGDVR